MFNQTSNIQIDDNIKTDLILKEGVDVIPKTITPTIQPVYDVYKRYSNVVRSSSRTTTGSTTIYTTPTDRDFFLTNIYMSNQSDATCDSTSIFIQFTVLGVVTYYLFPKLTLTALNQTNNIQFAAPIRVDRGTSIIMTQTFSVGASTSHGLISGFTNAQNQPNLELI